MKLAADLRSLETVLPRAEGVGTAIDLPPGQKFPSHNFQRAGLIEAQIAEIRKQLDATPDLLKRQ